MQSAALVKPGLSRVMREVRRVPLVLLGLSSQKREAHNAPLAQREPTKTNPDRSLAQPAKLGLSRVIPDVLYVPRALLDLSPQTREARIAPPVQQGLPSRNPDRKLARHVKPGLSRVKRAVRYVSLVLLAPRLQKREAHIAEFAQREPSSRNPDRHLVLPARLGLSRVKPGVWSAFPVLLGISQRMREARTVPLVTQDPTKTRPARTCV